MAIRNEKRIANAVAIHWLQVSGQAEDPPFEPLEELVFVDAHLDELEVVEGSDGSYDMVISPYGEFLYAISMFDGALVTFSRNIGTGNLAFLGRI